MPKQSFISNSHVSVAREIKYIKGLLKGLSYLFDNSLKKEYARSIEHLSELVSDRLRNHAAKLL